MELPAYVKDIRASYLKFFRSTLAEMRRREAGVVPEVLIRVNGPPEMDEVYHLLRADILSQENGAPQVTMIQLRSIPAGDTADILVGDQMVRVQPFLWEECSIAFSCVDPKLVRSRLQEWLLHRIDKEETHTPDQDGLHGIVHSMSPLLGVGTRHHFVADFGSAPVEIFEEVLNLLVQAGAQRISVGGSARPAVPSVD
jgi:hypothetical protein